jgi:hypothetical protein
MKFKVVLEVDDQEASDDMTLEEIKQEYQTNVFDTESVRGAGFDITAKVVSVERLPA